MQSCSQIVIANKPAPNFLKPFFDALSVSHPTVSELSTALMTIAFQVQTSFVVVCADVWHV